MRIRVQGIHPSTLLALLVVSTGCAAAAVGAGALGVLAYNEQGAEVNLDTTVEAASAATEAVFADLGITTTSRTAEDGEVEYQGRAGEMEVVVEIEDEDGVTEVEVTAEEGMLGWAPEYAEDVLQRIMDRL